MSNNTYAELLAEFQQVAQKYQAEAEVQLQIEMSEALRKGDKELYGDLKDTGHPKKLTASMKKLQKKAEELGDKIHRHGGSIQVFASKDVPYQPTEHF